MPGWTGYPLTADQDARDYDTIIQLWYARQEKEKFLNCDSGTGKWARWPRTAIAWYDGTITGLTATQLTDSAAVGWFTSSIMRWYDWTGPSLGLPSFYDVIVDDQDHPRDDKKIFRATITGNDATHLNFADPNWDLNVALADLIGKSYHIIRRGEPWWHDRIPRRPNDWEYAIGKVTAATATTLTGDKHWADSYWTAAHTELAQQPTAFDVLFKKAGSDNWRRAAVTANTADTLSFASGAIPEVGEFDFHIIKRGGYFRPQYRTIIEHPEHSRVTRRKWDFAPTSPFVWYSGPTQEYWTHGPEAIGNEILELCNVPALNIARSVPDGMDGCETELVPCFDVLDIWNEDPENYCEPGNYDHCHTPKSQICLRGLQVSIEEAGPNCIDPVAAAASPPRLVPLNFPELAESADIGLRFTRTITAVNATTHLVSFAAITMDVTPRVASWSLVNPTTLVHEFTGLGTLTNAGTLAGLTGHTFTSDDVGKSLIIALGWTAFEAYEFLRMFDQTHFLPDPHPTTGEPIDPPNPDAADPPDITVGVGQWVTSGKSTTRIAHNDTHIPDGSTFGTAVDGDEVFVNNKIYRFAGYNWDDATTGDVKDNTDPSGRQGLSFDWRYRDHFIIKAHKPFGLTPRPVLKGVASLGDDRSITLTGAKWFDGAADLRTETGTATSGSSTTVVDTTKAGNFFWTRTFGGRWLNFILEITSGAHAGVKFPITSHNPAGAGALSQTLGFVARTGVTIAAGDGYRIREPGSYELNRWQGRKLKLWEPDGTLHIVKIKFSDDETLFWDVSEGVTAAAGWRFQIMDYLPGPCFMWRDGDWIEPPEAEADPRDPRTRNWPTFSRDGIQSVLPTFVRRYRRALNGDYKSLETINEMYRAENLLHVITASVAWANEEDPEAPENNEVDGTLILTGVSDMPCDDLKAAITVNWDSGAAVPFSATEGDGPFIVARLRHAGDGDNGALRRRYAWAIANPPSCIDRVIKIWIKADPPCSPTGVIDEPTDPGPPLIPGFYQDCGFDSGGDSTATAAGMWGLAGFGSLGAGEIRIKVGNLDKPDFPPCPPALDGGDSYAESITVRGYQVTDKIATADYLASLEFHS